MENTTIVHKKGFLMSVILIASFLILGGNVFSGGTGLIGSITTMSLLGILGSAMYLVAGLGGIYGAKLLWKLEKKGLLIYLGALVLSLGAQAIAVYRATEVISSLGVDVSSVGSGILKFYIVVYIIYTIVIIKNKRKLT